MPERRFSQEFGISVFLEAHCRSTQVQELERFRENDKALPNATVVPDHDPSTSSELLASVG